jgi:hypothetical protein
MKKLVLNLIVFSLVICGCSIREPSYYEGLALRGGVEGAISRKRAEEQRQKAEKLRQQQEQQARQSEAAKFVQILGTARVRKVLSIGTVEEVLNSKYNHDLRDQILTEGVEKDWLPYEKTFYQLLKDEDYGKAEQIGAKWLNELGIICSRVSREEPAHGRCDQQKSRASDWQHLFASHFIQKSVKEGFVTPDQLNKIIYEISDPNLKDKLVTEITNKNLIPFRGMFFMALEKESYEEAELIRQGWVNYLKRMNECVSNQEVKARIRYRLEKLDVTGLTDPMLIGLRKELATALTNKNWDAANKIQDLITKRVAEVKPASPPPSPQIQPVIVQVPPAAPSQSESRSQVTSNVNEPGALKHEVQAVPRYGFKDVGRAVSLLDGKGGNLTSKQLGVLTLFDILTGR